MFPDSKSRSAQVNITINTPPTCDWQDANLAVLARRFWAKVRRGGDEVCWLWTASANGTGLPYGQFTYRARGRQHHVKAHRVAWMLTRGAIPDGLKVCHRCDVPLCCNPSHLFLGTQAENLADCRAKGRQPKVRRSKVSDQDVLAIRAAYDFGRRGDLARLVRQLGVSKAAVSRIAHRQAKTGVSDVAAPHVRSLAGSTSSAHRETGSR